MYITNTDSDLLQDIPVLPSGKATHDNKTASLNYSQNLVMSHRGARCQDGLTD